MNSSSEVNAIISIFVTNLDLEIRYNNVKIQKIDGFTFKIFKIVLANF